MTNPPDALLAQVAERLRALGYMSTAYRPDVITAVLAVAVEACARVADQRREDWRDAARELAEPLRHSAVVAADTAQQIAEKIRALAPITPEARP